MVGVVPYVGLNFAVYETLKATMLQHYGGCGTRGAPVMRSGMHAGTWLHGGRRTRQYM